MLNLAGPEFDLANVVHAVLADCEHRRRAITGDVGPPLEAAARAKLAAIRPAFDEAHGNAEYWSMIEHEVLQTALPQYIAIAGRQNDLERAKYEVWRGGDVAARATFALICLVAGGIIVEVPFIPIYIDAFAFVLAFFGWFYPDVKRLTHDFGFNRHMNRIVVSAEKYQKRNATQYLTAGSIDRMLASGDGDQTEKRA